MPLRTLLHLAAPYRYQLILVGFLTLGSSLIMLAIPWLGGQLLGGIIGREVSNTNILLVWLLLSLAIIATLNFAVAYVSSATTSRLLADLRLRIYEHLQALPIGFHESHRQGDTLALMTYEVASLSHFLTGTLVILPSQLLTVAGAIVIMFQFDGRLGLLVPLLLPAFYLILKVIGRRLRGLAQAIQQAEAEVVAIAEENLEMLPAIKAFTRERLETVRYGKQVRQALGLSLQQSRIHAALQPLISLVAAVAAVMLLFLAGKNVQTGGMTPTGLFSFLFYAALLTRPVGALAQVYGQIQMSRGTLARLQSVLAEATEPGYSSIGRLSGSKGRITFRNVAFAYPGREPTLRGLNLDIGSGEVIALTGPNGAGKSTLIKLLLRYYEPAQGEICVDGRNIGLINVTDLRRQIALVPQRVQLLNGTIRTNIGYGNDQATAREVEDAARLAQAWDFITKLPLGMDTEIGDHGVRLSGGQRQRVALARALVKDPQILVFDEATSMYDFEGQSAFITACVTALKGRTVILITHRSASLAMADRIVRLNDGKIDAI